MKNKTELKFQQQAARASWMFPLFALLLMGIGNSALQGTDSPLSGVIIGGVFVLILVLGFLFGLMGCIIEPWISSVMNKMAYNCSLMFAHKLHKQQPLSES